MSDSQHCSTCGADLAAEGATPPICVPCAFGLALDEGGSGTVERTTELMGPHTAVGERIGPYLLHHVLGEGGMGTVWEAHQEAPVRRRVALKRIKLGMDSAQVLARFESERQALALMSHANIAQVFDAGRTPAGQPYFAMEYVEGVWLTRFCDENKLSVPKRLDLFLKICSAIQHAHHKGVIHRDIKPSNILVQTAEGEAIPKVIDFGVAKAMGVHLTERTLVTRVGQSIGTPGYMSPEQAGPAGFDVDTRTDVYSLGVVLHELLTGHLPFEVEDGDQDELRRRIRQEDPKRPSARVAGSGEAGRAVAKARGTEPSALVKQLRGDLDWIVLKALAKDRAQRYGSPGELAADIQRHLDRQPVLAGPPGAAYRLSKFARRHTVGVTAASVILLLLVTTAVGMTVQARRVARERDRANREAKTSGAALQFLTDIFRLSDPEQSRGETITAREILDRGAAQVRGTLADDPEARAALMTTIGIVYRNLGLYTRAEPLLAEALEARKRLLGADDPATLRLVNETARLYLLEGRRKEAEALLQEALDIQKGVLGPEHPDTLTTTSSLASTYRAEGRYQEAEALHRETLDIRKRVLAPEHPDTLSSMTNLANAFRAQGRYQEAEALHREALDLRVRVLGPEHPESLNSRNSVAVACSLQGRHEEAEALYRETLQIQRRVLGPEHPDTLFSMTNLANAYRALGRPKESEALRSETLEVTRRVLGPEHPDTLSSMLNLANAYLAGGRPKEAEELYRETLEARKRVLGPEHPDTLSSMLNLANAYSVLGRSREAERLHRETLEIRERVLGPEHPETLRSMYKVACAAGHRGAASEALLSLREAVERGFSDTKALLEEPDLAALRTNPGFEAIVAAARMNQERAAQAR